nr:MAG TPA: hypothetical protein [Caudoviricetes sp.]
MFNILFFTFCYFFVGFILSLPYIYLTDKYCKLSKYRIENLPSFLLILFIWPICWIFIPVIILLIIQHKIKNS